MGQINGVVGSKLPKWADRTRAAGTKYDTATYLGVVKDNTDPIRSGRLRVWIPDFGGTEDNDKFWQTVSYASPFFGATFVGEATANNKFDTTNHTYGMWMVPPDLNNQVLCTFVNGDPDRGFWFACVNPTLSHYMVPAIAGTGSAQRDLTNASEDTKLSIIGDGNSQTLPVAEFNENDPNAYTSTFYNNPKPVHEPQANILFQQGVDRDPVLGAISSSSQRESPSHVFGISTPGRAYGSGDPVNDPGYEEKIKSGTFKSTDYVVKARTGGHTFVMDDGDVKGKDQLVRLRSAGGHTILMNDTEGIMFIINSAGSSWIELEKNGDMNIYNGGSFSVRAQGDLNLHADQNININAGKGVNITASTAVNATSAEVNISGSASALFYGGKTNIGAGGALTLGGGSIAVGSGGAITLAGSSVDISGQGGSNGISAVNLQKIQYPDTTYDSAKKIWTSVTGAASSIVSIFPTHQPWNKSTIPGGSTGIPTQTLPNSLCVPRNSAPPADYVLPKPNGNKLDEGKVKGQSVPWTTDTAFLEKSKQVAAAVGFSNYLDLLAAMMLETIYTFDPNIRGGYKNLYVGLIQFGPDAATEQRTTTQALQELTRVQQLDNVQTYLLNRKKERRLTSFRLCDLYACINWPVAAGQSLDYICYGTPGNPAGKTYSDLQVTAYKANALFDTAKKGYVTLGDFQTYMEGFLTKVKQALANAGAVNPAGTLQSGSGLTVTDGSGKPVNSGSTTSTATSGNIGVDNSAGKSISNQCPKDWLSKPELYKATAAISTTAPLLTQTYATNMIAELGYFESRWDYASTGVTNSSSGSASVGGKGTVLVMGDSIAYGTGDALKNKLPATSTMAEVGDNSTTILNNAKNPPAPAAGTKGTYQQYKYENDWVGKVQVAVISAGSNDIVKGVGNQTLLASNLLATRTALKAVKYIWIVPYDTVAAEVVRQAAAKNSDLTLSLSKYPTGDGLHPSSYPTVAADLQTMIASVSKDVTVNPATPAVTAPGTNIGKYQVDAQYLATTGYIKPDSIKQYADKTLSKNESWTNKDKIGSQQDFFKDKQTQDSLQDQEFHDNYTKLLSNQGIYADDDICTAAGMLFVAHKYRSADLAAEWRKTGAVKKLPTWTGQAGTAEEYFNHGRYAIDVLSAPETANATSPSSGLNGANLTNINPDDVFTFKTSGLGTRARFDQCTTEFKTAILNAAKAYKDKNGGKKVNVNTTYRSVDEQRSMRTEWEQAGGNAKDKPKVNTPSYGTLYIPALPGSSPHNFGVAMDCQEAGAIAAAVNLGSLGLEIIPGDRDPPHIQLKKPYPTGETTAKSARAPTGPGDKLVVMITGLESAGEPYKTGVKNLATALNQSGFDAQVFGCQDGAGAIAYITQNLGTKKLVLFGFSKGAEIVFTIAAAVKTVDLMICVDGFPTVGSSRLANLPANVTRAVNYYNPISYPKAGYGCPYPAPPASARVTHIQNNTSHIGIVAAIAGSATGDINGA